MMRHYQLVPVRYNAQQLLTPCEPIDAELWSIQWQLRTSAIGSLLVANPMMHWFADVSPMEYENAEAIVAWLNGREQLFATLSPPADVVPFNRSKP